MGREVLASRKGGFYDVAKLEGRAGNELRGVLESDSRYKRVFNK